MPRCMYIYIYENMRATLSDFVGVKHLLTDLVVFRIWRGFVQIVLLDLESMFDGFWIYVSIISWMDFWSWTASQASSRRQHHKLDVLFLSKYFRFTFNYQDASAVAETRLRRALDIYIYIYILDIKIEISSKFRLLCRFWGSGLWKSWSSTQFHAECTGQS